MREGGWKGGKETAREHARIDAKGSGRLIGRGGMG